MNQWYYAAGGQQQGPVSAEALRAMAGTGQVSPDTMVWAEGMAAWAELRTVPEFAGADAASGGHAQPGYAQPNYAAPGYARIGYAQPGYPPQAYAQPGGYGGTLGYAQPQSYAGAPVPGAYPGGFWWRVLAYLIDYIVLFIPNLIIQFGLNAVVEGSQQLGQSGQMPTAAGFGAIGLVFVAQVVINWLYYAMQESSAAQATLGKRACGLVVTDLQGQRIGFGTATGRYFGKILSGLILAIGFIMVAFTDRKQGLHDMMAGTLVWKKP